MKAKFLKLAGVKNEEEFYKKFPTEEAFMAKYGKQLKKAEDGFMGKPFQGMPSSKFNVSSNSGFNTDVSQNPYMSGSLIGGQRVQPSYDSSVSSSNSKLKTLGNNIKQGAKDLIKPVDLSTPSGISGVVGGISAGMNTIKQTEKNIGELEKYGKVSDVVLQARNTKAAPPQRLYDFPKLVTGMNPKGAGTNYLAARNGAEIQNTYAPDVMYTDLGYEPLNDSNKVKDFKKGGKLKKAISGEAVGIANTVADISKQTGQLSGQIYSNIYGNEGETGGYTQMLQSFGPLGGLAGAALDAPTIRRKRAAQSYLDKNTGLISGANELDNFTQQNSGFLEDGGWVSHDWQPQVIASFGEYSMKNLLKPDPMMDTLRAGGHLSYYTPPSERAMSTERAEYGTSMAMGGDLRTVWGGKAEPISYNPYLPNGGETVIFRGQSHDDTNSKGQSGIGVQYGEGGMPDYAEYGSNEEHADVEVQRNEPATVLKDADGKDNLLVFGGLTDPVSGKKFQNAAKDISKNEAKQNKIVEKSMAILNKNNIKDSYDQLAFNSAMVSNDGANMNLQKYAMEKEDLAHRQNAILDTAKEFKIKPEDIAYAKFGGKFEASEEFAKGGKKRKAPYTPFTKKAQAALKSKAIIPSSVFAPKGNDFLKQVEKESDQAMGLSRYYPSGLEKPMSDQTYANPRKIDSGAFRDALSPEVTDSNIYKNFDPYQGQAKKEAKSNDELSNILRSAYSSIYPFIMPTAGQPLDPNQLNPEYLASAMNQEEGVQARLYNPMLTQATSVSLQDQLNEVTAQTRDAMRMAQGDPSALAMIASQAEQAKSKILGEQLRMNQGEKQRVNDQNINTLNDAQKTNLGILDQQYVRQSTGKSKTKEQSIAIAKSIADKYAQNKAENRKIKVMENMYPAFSFTQDGTAYKNPTYLTGFGPGMGGGSGQSPYGGMEFNGKKFLPTNYDNRGNPTHYKVIGSETIDPDKVVKNGGVVKAFKNF
jgi:hypothetical protein